MDSKHYQAFYLRSNPMYQSFCMSVFLKYQTKLNHNQPIQTKTNQTKSKPTKPYQKQPNQTKTNQAKSNQAKSNWVHPNQIEFKQVI